MGKVITVLGVVVILGGAAYMLWGDSGSFQVSFLDEFKSSASTKSSSSTQEAAIKKDVQNIGSQAVQWVSNAAESFINSVAQTAKDEISKKVQETAQDAYHSVGEKIGIATASDDFIIRYITRPGAQTSFTVQNMLGTTATGTLDYHVTWGDGNESAEQGVSVQPSYLLSHTWTKAGEYDVVFRFIYNEKESVSNIHVQVEE